MDRRGAVSALSRPRCCVQECADLVTTGAGALSRGESGRI